jgi:hypothetical protein
METITQYEEVAVATTDIEVNDIIHLCILPANCVPTGYVLDSSDLDNGGTAAVLDFGIITSAANTDGTAISTAANDGGDEWIDGSTLAQAGGIALDSASAALWRVLRDVQPVNYDRKVAVVVAVAPTTPQAGTIACQLSYRAAR